MIGRKIKETLSKNFDLKNLKLNKYMSCCFCTQKKQSLFENIVFNFKLSSFDVKVFNIILCKDLYFEILKWILICVELRFMYYRK